MKNLYLTLAMLLASLGIQAQYYWNEYDEPEKMDLANELKYNFEIQASTADGKTPLWLNANRHGLSSLEKQNGYVRGSLIRSLRADSARRWGVGYGVDVAVPMHYTNDFIIQQAFVEGRWLHGALTIGAKEYPMEMKNQTLSTGGQTLGINARPVPQVRISLPEYWRIPILGGWFHLKGHVAYGLLTDDNWQRDFTQQQSKYTSGTRFHSKAGYLKIGNEEQFEPWSLEMGLEMGALFGGESHIPMGEKMAVFKGDNGIKGMWHALMPGGADVPEKGTEYQNAEGDQLGSWMIRLNYDDETWAFRAYAEKFFEDHSMMLQLDYNGYGTGDEWNVKKERRFFLYNMKDILLGVELNFKYGTWIRNFVAEYFYSKYQSGPVYHDHTPGFPDHISGRDDYYNHYIYAGWQHWGQVMGNPLYRSPIYNDNGVIHIDNNRSIAYHLGVDGTPTEQLGYRVLVTYQNGLGTYDEPFTHMKHFVGFLTEASYQLPKGWKVKGAYAMDFGHLLGENWGVQLTISKSGFLKKKKD